MAGTPNNIHVVDYAAVPKGPYRPATHARGVSGAHSRAGIRHRPGALSRLPRRHDQESQRYRKRTAFAFIGSHSGSRPDDATVPANHTRPAARWKWWRAGTVDKRTGAYGAGRSLQTPANLHPFVDAWKGPKTLLVTSSVPAEGKTTTAVNTATVLAQTGAKVLIIDADMRRPRLHQVFGLPNDGCLSAILSSEIEEADILSRINQYKRLKYLSAQLWCDTAKSSRTTWLFSNEAFARHCQ